MDGLGIGHRIYELHRPGVLAATEIHRQDLYAGCRGLERRDPAAGRSGFLPTFRWPAGGRYRRAPRHRRHAHTDGLVERALLANRPALGDLSMFQARMGSRRNLDRTVCRPNPGGYRIALFLAPQRAIAASRPYQ